MEVVITVHEHNLHYKGVRQLNTTRDVVVLTLDDNYQVDDKEFAEEHNIGIGGFIHQFVDCSGVFVAEKATHTSACRCEENPFVIAFGADYKKYL